MSFSAPFPMGVLHEISEYPGNQKCCDCPSLDTDWGSINHGTLICLDCAGKHRSLGVQVSFVRSIFMDTWSPLQVEMMRQGGNGQIREFFKKLQIESTPITTLYSTKGASSYRDKLRERAEKVLSGEIPYERRVFHRPAPPPAPPPVPAATTTSDVAVSHTTAPAAPPLSPTLSVTPEATAPPSPATSPHAPPAPPAQPSHPFPPQHARPPTPRAAPKEAQTVDFLEARFAAGPMGVSLTRDLRGAAVVSRVLPAGPAQRQGEARLPEPHLSPSDAASKPYLSPISSARTWRASWWGPDAPVVPTQCLLLPARLRPSPVPRAHSRPATSLL